MTDGRASRRIQIPYLSLYPLPISENRNPMTDQRWPSSEVRARRRILFVYLYLYLSLSRLPNPENREPICEIRSPNNNVRIPYLFPSPSLNLFDTACR